MDKMEKLERLARAAKQDFTDFDMPWPRAEDVVDLNPTADVAAYIASCSPEVILRLVAIARAAAAMLNPNTNAHDTMTEAALREALKDPQ